MALTLFLMAGLPPCISSETAVFFIYKLSINFKIISHPSQVRIRRHHIRRLHCLFCLLLTPRLPHLPHLLQCVLRHISCLRPKHTFVPMCLQIIHCLLLPKQFPVTRITLIRDVSPQKLLIEEWVVFKNLTFLDWWLVKSHEVISIHKFLHNQVAL